MEPDLKKIGLAIKIFRIKCGISQTALAERLGLSQTHMNNVEHGKVMLGLKTLFKLRHIFGCALEDIIEPKF